MRVNFDRVLRELDGTPLKHSEGKDLTLAHVCTMALVNDTTGDGAEKERRYRMAVRLFPGGAVDLPAEDVAFLKEVVGRIVVTPIHAGQARQMLDGVEAAP